MSSHLHAYCTYFDSGYLSRGLALIESLRSHGDHSPVWIMALDDSSRDYLEDVALPGVHVLAVAQLEQAVPRLAALKSGRSRMEYCFTMTPLLVRWVMDQYPRDAASVAYLDADLFYFDDPSRVFDAMGDDSVGIIEHRHPPRLARRLAKYGRFNVGWVGFRADERGKACLDWWGESTLAWCRDVPEGGKYADQGYLDSFPEHFEGVRVLELAGFDLAPWNTARHQLNATADRVSVDGGPLVFFHFHGLKRVRDWWISSQLVYGAPMDRTLRNLVYRSYVRRLEVLDAQVAASGLVGATEVAARGSGLRGLSFRAQRALLSGLAILTGNALAARKA